MRNKGENVARQLLRKYPNLLLPALEVFLLKSLEFLPFTLIVFANYRGLLSSSHTYQCGRPNWAST